MFSDMSNSKSLLPPLDATSSAIRSYFVQVLQNHYDVPKTEAEDIAARWQYSRGRELRSYDIDTFRAILGVEAGSLLFAYIKKETKMAKSPSNLEIGKKQVVEKKSKDIFGLTPGCKLPIF